MYVLVSNLNIYVAMKSAQGIKKQNLRDIRTYVQWTYAS